MFFNGYGKLLISDQEPAASHAGPHAEKQAFPPEIDRFFSVRVLWYSVLHSHHSHVIAPHGELLSLSTHL